LRYFFRYVEGLPEDAVSASLVFGGSIHRAVEEHLRERLAGNPAPTLDALMAAYNDGWQEHETQHVQFGKGDDRSTLDDLARRMLTAFQASDLAEPAGTIIGIEEELTGELVPGVPDLLARVDLLVDGGDALTLTDLKTARSRWSNEQVQDSAGQLLLYHELAKPIADGRPIKLEFAVITKTKTPEVVRYEVPADPRQIDRTKRIVETVWKAIEAGIFFPSPSAMNCPSCPFRKACRSWSG
jgi:putative RecB family exonuclease